MPGVSPVNNPVALVTGATTGVVPVTVYEIPEPLAGAVTVIVPVETIQVGCVVTLAVGAAGAAHAHELVTTLFSQEIAPAIERPLPKREELPNKWIGPSATTVPLKTEPVAKSNCPPICQYTLHNEAELIRETVEDAAAAKAPPILITNKAFELPPPSNIKFPSNVEAAPVL